VGGGAEWSIIIGMGFNPFRQQRRRTSDYVLLAAAFIVIALLVLWAFLG
jgi:hypothetical protein